MTSITNTQANETASTSSKKIPLINPWLALAIALAAATFAGPFIKLSQEGGLPSPVVAAGRMSLAAIILTPLVLGRYRDDLRNLTGSDILWAMAGGVLLCVHFVLLIFALENTSILIVTVILNTGPLWVALLERVFLKERVNKWVWLGLFITIIGSTFIAFFADNETSAGANNVLLGAGLSVTAAMCGASYITLGRNIRQKISLFPYIWIVFGFGGIVGIIISLASGTPITGHPSGGYFWLLMLTLIPQLIGHSGFNYVLGYISATLTSLSNQMLTVTAATAAFFIFGEVPGVVEVVGSLIIAVGVVMALLMRSRKKDVEST
ncbi:MAG: DMT family transporter [Chloroflexota bacterium]